ncbi:MAG: hypothetical protein U9Q66_00795 [Patescibacteria group bacterium]|nr:hypothetical protein [Patescibacteria group bacterium]
MSLDKIVENMELVSSIKTSDTEKSIEKEVISAVKKSKDLIR